MSNTIAPGSSADVNVRVTALTTNPNVPVTYKTIILKKNLVNGVNTLTQEMMSAQNTKYVIKYDYVLGEDITIPANCVLEFDGGSIVNTSGNSYIIYTNNTYFKGNGYCAVALNGQFQYDEIDIFGVRPANSAAENSANIAKFMQSVSPKVHSRDNVPNNYIRFGQGVYNFSEPITIIGAGGVYGAGDGATHLIFANSDGLRFNMNIPNSYMGLDISGFYIECANGNAIDLVYQYGEHTGTNVHNITIKAPNGAGITTTVSSQNVYGCNFENIRFINCLYCMANMSLTLNTTVKNCIDFSCRIWFYNCFFQETYFIGGNVGWGHHLHFIYADKSWHPFDKIRYSLYIIGCNFEEFESNIVVIKKPTDYPNDIPTYHLTFKDCFFNNPQLSGHNIYVFKDDYSDLKEKVYTSYSEYYPIVGFEIVPKFINCRSSIQNDNNQQVSIPIYVHTSNYASHSEFNDIGAIIYVHAYLSASWLNFIYNGKKVVSFKEMLDNPVISAKFTSFEMFYLRLGTRDSIFVNDSNSDAFSINFDQNNWAIGNSFRIVTNNSNVVLLQGFASSGMNMNKTASYNYFRVGGQYFNTDSKKILTCTGSSWVDATGATV